MTLMYPGTGIQVLPSNENPTYFRLEPNFLLYAMYVSYFRPGEKLQIPYVNRTACLRRRIISKLHLLKSIPNSRSYSREYIRKPYLA